MGSDNLFHRRKNERQQRKENVKKQKSSNWLIVCEGLQTEPNYFQGAIEEFNGKIEEMYKLKVKIVGKGMNTISLVKTVEYLQNEIDGYRYKTIPYGKIFVVFDKDSFDDETFDKAIQMCHANGYIPLWSNQAIEYWFLLYFHYIESGMDRQLYSDKISKYFKEKGYHYKYQKNDKDIYKKLGQYGSLEAAKKNALKIHQNCATKKPSKSESCTTIYKFFEELEKRKEELK